MTSKRYIVEDGDDGINKGDRKMTIMGLDLSLTGTGICVLERGTEGKGFLGMIVPFKVLHTETVGYSLTRKDTENDRIERLVYNAKHIVDAVKYYGVTHVGIENYAFSRHGANISSAELGGVVKSQILLACRIVPTMVTASAARKDLFGPMKRKDGKVKDQVRTRLKLDGLEFKTDDEMDAFVIALSTLRKNAYAVK